MVPGRQALPEREYSRALGLLRLLGLYVLMGAMLYLGRPTPLSLATGFVLVALGEAIRIWAAGHLRKSVELVTTGPYRYTRNPLYLGRLLIFTGLCIMARLPLGISLLLLVGGYAVFFGYYLRRKERVEGDRLRERHGEAFERYRRAVPALFPRYRPYGAAASGAWSGARMRANQEHWMVLGLLAVCLFLLCRALLLHGRVAP